MYSFTEIKTYYYYERAHSDNFSAVPSYRENLVYWSCINTQRESKQAYPYVCDDALFACTKCHRIIWQDETQRYKDQQVILNADNIVFLYRKLIRWRIYFSIGHLLRNGQKSTHIATRYSSRYEIIKMTISL